MDKNKKKAVAIWLIAGVVMIIIQTLLGGVTRLTGSGLSITEWKPIMGTLPPMNEHEWNKAFDGYKQIGQYKLMNSNFTLSDFKAIFFWEWFHRVWARMLFVVFAIGFSWFWVKKYFDKQMIKPFIILLVLGGFQGLIGWLMVKTGLNSEDIHVHYIALSIHFIAAMILACYTLWFALQLLIPEEKRFRNKAIFNFTIVVIVVVFLQLMYGGYMAGMKAALAAPTWPSINGTYIPATLSTNGWIKDTNIAALQLNVQFIHRGLAYLLILLIAIWFWMTTKKITDSNATMNKTKWYPIVLVCIQVLLGIFTVLSSTSIKANKFGLFETFAELHQLVAMFLLMSMVVNLYAIRRSKSSK